MPSEAPTPQTPTETSRETEGDEPDHERSGLSEFPDHLQERPGKRTSGSVELLVIEAELVAAGKDLDNPAVPANEVFEDALEELERKDLDPAWIVCREGLE